MWVFRWSIKRTASEGLSTRPCCLPGPQGARKSCSLYQLYLNYYKLYILLYLSFSCSSAFCEVRRPAPVVQVTPMTTSRPEKEKEHDRERRDGRREEKNGRVGRSKSDVKHVDVIVIVSINRIKRNIQYIYIYTYFYIYDVSMQVCDGLNGLSRFRIRERWVRLWPRTATATGIATGIGIGTGTGTATAGTGTERRSAPRRRKGRKRRRGRRSGSARRPRRGFPVFKEGF